jgi:hypothetical protein
MDCSAAFAYNEIYLKGKKNLYHMADSKEERVFN